MSAKKRSVKKGGKINSKVVEKPKPRIPKGSVCCTYDSISLIIENLMFEGFRLEDLKHTSMEFDYTGCYYPDDNPSICVEWSDII